MEIKLELDKISKLLLVGGGEQLISVAEIGLSLGLDVFAVLPRGFASAESNGNSLTSLQKTASAVAIAESLEAGIEELGESFREQSFNLCVSNPWILREREIQGFFGGKIFNCHGTLLPRDRGGGGFSWRILMGNRYGSVNLYLVNEGVDTGSIVSHQEFIYPDWCRLPVEFDEVYQSELLPFLESEITEMVQGKWSRAKKPQVEYLSSYWPRLNTDINGYIDWSWSCRQVYQFICAFDNPYPGAITHWNGEEVRLKDVSENYSDGAFHPFQNGQVYRKGDGWIDIAVSDGNIIARSVSNSRGVSLLDKIRVGDRLWTQSGSLESARKRQFLDAKGWT